MHKRALRKLSVYVTVEFATFDFLFIMVAFCYRSIAIFILQNIQVTALVCTSPGDPKRRRQAEIRTLVTPFRPHPSASETE
jgi:hypothetical protein